jgi:hypothetical protein
MGVKYRKKKGAFMKRIIILFICIMVLSATIGFVSESADAESIDNTITESESIQQEVEALSNNLNESRQDGRISVFENYAATYNVSQEAKEAFNELAMEQAKEEIDALPSIATNSDINIDETQTINLDCGAQLIIRTHSEDVAGQQSTGMIGKLLNTLIQSANAYDMTYGNKKYYQSATMISAGWVTVKSWTTVSASATGLKITKVSNESNSAILMNDLETKGMIEDQYANVAGTNCHSRVAVKYNGGVLGLHSPSDWYNLRVTFTISKIDNVKKKIYYTYGKDTWYSSSWN